MTPTPSAASGHPVAGPSGKTTFVVYAPFGTDKVLSTFPDGATVDVAQHPLVQNLLKVAQSGCHVTALVDMVDEETYLIDIPANRPADMRITSQWKQDMDAPQALTGLLRHANEQHPGSTVVLAVEGHGAGFLPDLDRREITLQNITKGGAIRWEIAEGLSKVSFESDEPVVSHGAPILPVPCPTCPTNHLALSTYALGAALKAAQDAGVPKLACIHFNNCFNMAVEVLHTIAPHAEFATGYENYNFFTAGEAYPGVFAKLQAAGSATPQQLAQWFADGNHEVLAAKGHHPTVGCVVQLSRMHSIVECIDDMSDALLAALRTAEGAQRAAYVGRIKAAIARAQQFDTDGNMDLDPPDELTDICSFAHELQKEDFGPFKVQQTAAALEEVLKGIKRYGDVGHPWTDPAETWDFSRPDLAMNIFLPDPMRIGKWDWRSPYYLDVNPDPAKPQVQPHIIEFVKVTDWVDFIIEYHKDVPFIGLLPAQIPEFPHFNKSYKPPRGDDGRKPQPPCTAPGSAKP
jgi:hypothetical protein